jgi:MFS transporter, AAHS family, 3-hydroxyphenylpropionic acid transporter
MTRGEASAIRGSPVFAVTVGLCFAVAVLEGFDIQALGVAAPRLAVEFHLSPAEMGWLFSIGNLGLVAGASLGGWLADRTGRKPVFIGAVLCFGVFTLAIVGTSGFPALFAARLLAGLGFGAALPNMMAVAAEISLPHRRASSAAAMFCGMPFGGGLSALLTQVLPADMGWRALFVIGGSLPMLLAPALHYFMPETYPPAERSGRRGGGVAEALFGAGRVAPTLLLWLAFLPTLLMLYLILNWLPTLVAAKGLDRAAAPQASLAFNFASVAGALLLGWIVDRKGARWPLVVAYGALIGALWALSRVGELPLILILSATAGFFLMGANYALYGVAASYYPQSVRGTGAGASVAVGRVGAVVGPLLAGLLLNAGLGAADVILLMAPAAVLAGVAVLALSYFPRAV